MGKRISVVLYTLQSLSLRAVIRVIENNREKAVEYWMTTDGDCSYEDALRKSRNNLDVYKLILEQEPNVLYFRDGTVAPDFLQKR